MRRSERFSSHTLPTYLGRAQIVVQAGRMRGQLKVKSGGRRNGIAGTCSACWLVKAS